MNQLEIKDLHVNVEDKEILKGVNLTVKQGEIAALMGPNGSGKSTLSYTIMGHPKYEVTKGKILWNGEDITEMDANERAQKGVFLSFQYPAEVPGVPVSKFLRLALNAVKEEETPIPKFIKLLKEKMSLLKVDSEFSKRYLNEGFSGGEKKRMEILQMAMLDPKIAILDETDSGLDISSLKVVGDGVNTIKKPETSILIITHYQRILNYIKPDTVHVMADGKIITSGGKELAHKLEEEGYEGLLKEN